MTVDPWALPKPKFLPHPLTDENSIIREAQWIGMPLSLLDACRVFGTMGTSVDIEVDPVFRAEVFQQACDFLAEHGYVFDKGWLKAV